MTGFDLRDRLDEIVTPTLVVFGGRGRLVDPADSRALAASLRRGRPHEFPHAGHALFLEHHREFGRVVARFAGGRLKAIRRDPATVRPAIAPA